MVKLALNISGYPKRFEEHEIILEGVNDKKSYIEKLVIAGVNKVNEKLNIDELAYLNFKEEFPHLSLSSYSGLILREYLINEESKNYYEKCGYQIKTNGDKISARKILAYVFLTSNKEEGRNVLVSQSIFPSLIDNMDKYLDSPSFTLLNHPIYFINLIEKQVTASTFIRHLAYLIASDFRYIEVFDSNVLDSDSVPSDITEFMNKYMKELNTEYVTLDTSRKILKILPPPVEMLHKSDDGIFSFKGSEEKFYWLEILPISIIASKNGFNIDFEDYQKFIVKYEPLFPVKNDKMKRCVTLLEYLKKLSLKKYYHV